MTSAAQKPARPVGLFAALIACIIAVGWLFHYSNHALHVAEKYVRALGPANNEFKARTLTMQRAALKMNGILPVYGTSELYCCAGSFNAGYFYAHAPTGFTVMSVGYPLTADLFWAETFGALGNDLRGRKLVVSDSGWFMTTDALNGGITSTRYDNTYEPEIAAVFTFDAPIPLALRAAVARRMVDFPSTLANQSVLQAGLLDLARGGVRGYAAYLLLDPTGRLVAWSDELYDARTTIQTLNGMAHPGMVPVPSAQLPRWRRLLDALDITQVPERATPSKTAPLNPNVPIKPQQINWNAELAQATQQAKAASASNPFGVQGGLLQSCGDIEPVSGTECAQALKMYANGQNNHAGNIIPPPKGFLQGMIACSCWTDLNLEFETLKSVGANPLVWMQPFQGYLDDHSPYSAPTRRAAYDRYLALAKADGIRATTFETHDDDPLFTNSFGHMSQRGWVYADRLINLFWHNQLSEVSTAMQRGGATGALFSPSLNCPVESWCQGVDNVPPLPGELAGLPEGMPSLWG